MNGYLLTSDFVNGETPDQLRELLFKFRYEYRQAFANIEVLNRRITVKDDKINRLKKENEELKNKLAKSGKELSYMYEKTKKKLSFKERLTGKININK